ncbi:Predicted nucleic acid-binding protein, contains PIN domain [Lysobacter sp. yr284]|uniref:PIN domain-containing protein n=1 Tax=Lysobacter sp. yr284 TaxID=1761791 RepID=UPI00089D50F2|nr:PIN domain-containing protein [Lysobacter sp. yr284]SDY69653.1 Predicted nucleic acid-binding protein, contains PIN domain [Lysobacter sp. yr284]
MSAAPRIVLDSNVCLDLFAFADPAVAPLLQALRSGAVTAVTDAPCREEWQRILDYPQLRLDPAARARCLREYDELLRPFAHAGEGETKLPRCADPDDQKFLELAHAAGARWLLSRDHALVVLGRRTARAGWFEIMTPRTWVALEAWRSRRD